MDNDNACCDCGFEYNDQCTCPATDRWYACPLEPEPRPEDFMTMKELEELKRGKD